MRVGQTDVVVIGMGPGGEYAAGRWRRLACT
jgi:pyruvate/2-oxoglutarate dehydrogenase complex dihydrolipoamide dehydrogenase (E3) component